MVRKVIPSRVRKHNALKVKSKNRFLLRKRSAIAGSTELKRSSKTKLNDKEAALFKKLVTPLVRTKKVHSKVKRGSFYLYLSLMI